MNYEQAAEKLARFGQEHVLKYYEELTEQQKEALLTQIEGTDFSVLSHIENKNDSSIRGKITPLSSMQLPQIRESFSAACS